MAGLAVAEKRADDGRFAALLGPLADGADDDRPLVRTAASWALRAIGKRGPALNRLAIATAEQLRDRAGEPAGSAPTRSGSWAAGRSRSVWPGGSG